MKLKREQDDKKGLSGFSSGGNEAGAAGGRCKGSKGL